jgi:signal transduction histidine kinase
VVKGYTPNDRTQSAQDSTQVQEYDSISAMLIALSRGEIDATTTDAVTAAHNIKVNHLTNLRLGSALGPPAGLYFGMARSKATLGGIIDKAVASMTPEERRAIDTRWIAVDIAPSPWLRAFKVTLICVGAGLLGFLLLAWHNRRLSRELAERVRIQRQIAVHVAEVEQLNVELESFSYIVSHDLRAPLRNITGFLDLLTQRTAGRLDAEADRYIATAAREAGRMGTLIDGLLAFARMGRVELKLTRVALDELVNEVRAELAPTLGQRTIEWRIGVLPVVGGDRLLLRQVVANLLGNAVKFSRQRTPAVIEVSATTDGGSVTVCVRDNGAGFNPKYADKLFGVFQRLHNQRDFEGTGIGLANVKRIVERHGGRVWAEGGPDQGATFYFTLPEDAVAERAEPPRDPPAPHMRPEKTP